MKTIPEIIAAFARTDVCAESMAWCRTHTSVDAAKADISAEWLLVAARHYVNSSAVSVTDGQAAVEQVIQILTLRPVPSRILELVATVRSRIAAPCSNDRAHRARLAAAFELLLGIWSSIGKPSDLEPLMRAKLLAFVDFNAYVDATKK